MGYILSELWDIYGIYSEYIILSDLWDIIILSELWDIIILSELWDIF